ncbi:MAG: FAD-dependent oxidoreductase [Candidatus Aminicenantales bacterium]
MPKKSIAVVGGGISGLAAAAELARSGRFQVVLFEKSSRLGGLSGFYEWQDIACDRFYHVILSTDAHLRDYIREIGLGSELFWRRTRTGFFGEKRLVSLSSVPDYLKFPFLNPLEKLRLGAGILFAAHRVKPGMLDGLAAAQWLENTFGRKTFQKLWGPLLRSKLGDAAKAVPAAYIQAAIKRLYGARSLWKKHELMGHVRGGYRRILGAAREDLVRKGVSVLENAPVIEAGPENGGKAVDLRTASSRMRFDKILLAVPPPEALGILSPADVPGELHSAGRTGYLGIVCLLLVLRRRLSPFYMINLLDPGFPFTGVIESTNVISPGEMNGKHLVYLPKYLAPGDPLNDFPDEKIAGLFLERLQRIFPGLREDEILHLRVFRADYAQPVGPAEFRSSTEDCLKAYGNIFLLNKATGSHFVPNNNSAVQIAREAARKILAAMNAPTATGGN